MSIARSLLWIPIIGLSLSAAAQQQSPPEYRVFRPGPVVPTGNDPFVLVGNFSVAPDPITSPIEETSHGSGGACIFGDLAAHGAPEQSCSSNAECHQAWATYHQANLSNPDYDAAAFGSVGNGSCVANRCWYRPGGAACARRPFPNVWENGNHKFGPFSLTHVARLYGEDADIDWRVVTCANRARPDGTDAASCLQGVGIYR